MNPLTLEWLEKAAGDFATARRELRVRQERNYDAVCFHAQQSVEKYLKAILQEQGANIPRTHQLMDLLALCAKVDISFLILQPDLISLEGYAVMFRYPGQSADRTEAKAAFKVAEMVRSFVRVRLKLE